MGFMDTLKQAEADLSEFGAVAEEIAAHAKAGLDKLKAHRDVVKGMVEQALGAGQGIAGKLSEAVTAEQQAGDGSQFLGRGVG